MRQKIFRALAALTACLVWPHITAAATPAEACAGLAGLSIEPSAISLPTHGATIASATLIAADAPGNVDGAFCKVNGAILPDDPSAPNINFEVNLPSQWNNKALHIGGGGYDGQLIAGLGALRFAKPGSETPLKRGFVTFGSDSGHQGSNIDGSFALNAEALRNFGGDQLRKTHDVAFDLINRRYGRLPERLYFFGNSQGGHEGLIVAQRWPQDYDGVVSIHPVYDFIPLQIDGNALSRAMYNPAGGWLNPAKLKLLQDSVMKACDGLDGVVDGIISNVAACAATFKLAELRCAEGKDTGDDCLSDAQIRTVETINAPVPFGFALAGGISSFPRWPILEGADWTGVFGLGVRPEPSNPPQPMKDFGLTVFSDPAIRYMILGDPNANPLTFDPSQHQARLSELSRMMDASSPDLSAFKARGGKLILMHGTTDSAVSPYSTIAYYQRLQAQFGQGPLDEFVRFYVAPGFGHGAGPFVVGWDALGALEAWVEQGVAPGPQVVVDTGPNHRMRTRPLCRYPEWPRYVSGDVDAAASFGCVTQ
jgi:pimeloyl-ACP methyl ester carboxylesterase